ncbi:hypothetical protein HYPSUDRAFT_313187 [Hypholoma sublateritium FD-334 SS-4]|uniref:G-protein coupled receptors family 3 profile domain-containing protein n=1 Tax=Hypholoma sublateritium (strain FD-334 SS-4) TaxID=945553 RepID=A0A0D2P5W9_HYPSF|nr:hypothetical protein HYPSUDRAFT_313187 [Hypholoma sublateritium FD-334 SS-4]
MFLPGGLSLVLPREPQPDDISGTTKNVHFIIIYDVLFGVGWALLSIIFLTAVLARKVQRTPMWIVSVAAWVIYSFANLMMVGLQDNKPPVYALCLLQAMLIYASPVFCALIVASFLLQTYCSMSQRQGLSRSMLSGGLTIIGMLAIYTFEGLILILVHRRSGKHTISRGMMLRMGIFSVWALVILVISFLQYIPSSVALDNAKVEIIQGTLPCIGAIAFGTKRDLFEVWMFWKRGRAAVPEHAGAEGQGETTGKVVLGP